MTTASELGPSLLETFKDKLDRRLVETFKDKLDRRLRDRVARRCYGPLYHKLHWKLDWRLKRSLYWGFGIKAVL